MNEETYHRAVMNEEAIEKLVDWSIEKMGWDIAVPTAFQPWRPDLTHTGQIWMFVNRMKYLGWRINFDDLSTPGQYDVEFIHKDYNPDTPRGRTMSGFGSNTNPCIAILLAAWNTERGFNFSRAKMSPKSTYPVEIEVKSIKKATPRIVEPD